MIKVFLFALYLFCIILVISLLFRFWSFISNKMYFKIKKLFEKRNRNTGDGSAKTEK